MYLVNGPSQYFQFDYLVYEIILMYIFIYVYLLLYLVIYNMNNLYIYLENVHLSNEEKLLLFNF